MACDDGVMRRPAFALRRARRFAAGLPHAGQPPAAGEPRPARLRHVDRHHDVVGEALHVRRGVGVAAADPPDAVQAEPGDGEERDLARVVRLRDVVDAQAGRKSLAAVLEGLRKRSGEVVLLLVVFRQRPDIGAVDRQQDAVVQLDMVRAGVGRIGDKGARLGGARVAHVDHRDAVAEHMADIGVAVVDHHLGAVRPAALIAAGEEADVFGHGLYAALLLVHVVGARVTFGKRQGPVRRAPGLAFTL